MAYPALPFPLPVVPPRFTAANVGAQNRKLAQKLYKTFFSWPIERSRRILETTPADVWEREGQKRALQVFHAAAERVPAYKDFLRKRQVQPDKVQTISDFKSVVPQIDKEKYLRAYPLEDLCWDGILASTQMISVSSGSTGEPFFWPRGLALELETTYLHDLFLSSFFLCDRIPTLFLDCFSMGMYVAGPITLSCVLRLAQKGYPIRVITPGIEMDDILRVVPRLTQSHKQIVIAGYPPFIKDVLDEIKEARTSRVGTPMKFLLAGEGFNETWRDYVAELAGRSEPARDFINLYGTADAAILAHETPFSIQLRRLAVNSDRLRESLFQSGRLPSFLQYYPTLRYFEVVDRELLFTASGGVPLVRYNIHDLGGILSYERAMEIIRKPNSYFANALRRPRLADSVWKLPLVYLFGKSDLTTTLYGLNVYPENIRAALERPEIRRMVTGRFTMSTEYKRNQDQYLLIKIELAAGVTPSRHVRREILGSLIVTLSGVNAEYRKLLASIGRKAHPSIRLAPRGEDKYFPRKGKQKWVRKVLPEAG